MKNLKFSIILLLIVLLSISAIYISIDDIYLSTSASDIAITIFNCSWILTCAGVCVYNLKETLETGNKLYELEQINY